MDDLLSKIAAPEPEKLAEYHKVHLAARISTVVMLSLVAAFGLIVLALGAAGAILIIKLALRLAGWV